MNDGMRYPDSCDCVNEVEEARCEAVDPTGQFIYTRVSACLSTYLPTYLPAYPVLSLHDTLLHSHNMLYLPVHTHCMLRTPHYL